MDVSLKTDMGDPNHFNGHNDMEKDGTFRN